MNGIIIQNNRVVFYGNTAGYVDGDKIVLDPMFRCEELQNFTKQQKLEVQWADGVFDRLSAGDVNADSNVTMLKACRIFQLKPTVSPEMKFISYDEMVKNFGEPSSENYDAVYNDQVESNDLEAIYEKFNLHHPEGFIGHSLSMSDIPIIFKKEGINTMQMASEMTISLLGSFAQAESESLSKNVTWGIRQKGRGWETGNRSGGS